MIVGRSENVWLKKIILGEDLGRGRNDTINMGGLMLTIYLHLKTKFKKKMKLFCIYKFKNLLKSM